MPNKIWLQIKKVRSVKRIAEVYFKISSHNLPTVVAQAKTQSMYPYIYSECNIYAPSASLMCAIYHASLTLLDLIIRMELILGLDLNSFFRVGDQVLRPQGIVSIIKTERILYWTNQGPTLNAVGRSKFLRLLVKEQRQLCHPTGSSDGK